METHLADFIRSTPSGREAEAILRRCVHCGFCNATCPTYQLTGDELDGPRGRIYQIKQVLEGAPASERNRVHLDRCLTCRACETTCPSGVEYGRLLDIGRATVLAQQPRRGRDALRRALLRAVLPQPRRFAIALGLGRLLRPLLPLLREKLPPARVAASSFVAARSSHPRRMLALAGCVQPSLTADTLPAARALLDRLGIALDVAPQAGCCGALALHLDDADAARQAARRNIDAWWPGIEAGAEAIVITASGCGVQVKDYGHLLGEDARYAGKAARIAGLARDIGEVVAAESAGLLPLLAALPSLPAGSRRLAFHSPCTLQHGQRIVGQVEALLVAAGFELVPVADAHLCCGSAGTYSLLQPEWSNRLRADKLAKLGAGGPALIVSANVGCITHLQGGTRLPVRHWVEVLAERVERFAVYL
ncbi:MAG: glycolate oxidase iron-sulfur subunit [Betaproteobacteria bacterium HGW-Betaproteobacteria-11]|nr:MAG: glycolate oxidase iron-sulfur subunit [Betaproteobacteria bacterium HGW-Betaproteobacteria-11]